MAGNSFGKNFVLTTFGESHGKAIGGIVDGCPSNILLDIDFIQSELDKRKPGQSHITTSRKESDAIQILSGIFEGKTTGAPIGFIIPNENQNSSDYQNLKDKFRPSHADYTYFKKYGIRDYAGGGRSSARETACRVVGGAIAKQIIGNIKITAFVSRVGNIKLSKPYTELPFTEIEKNIVRCPDEKIAQEMIQFIEQTKLKGDSVGGVITCVIQNVPVGLGEPVFDKLEAQLAKAMLSINATKGFQIGSGFNGTTMFGSEHNDQFNSNGTTKTNYSGGVQGGISNGMDIYFDVAFKPTATILNVQPLLNTMGNIEKTKIVGRHDACILPRAVVIVEAMAAMVLADFLV